MDTAQVLLLKTKSTPSDAYEDFFSSKTTGNFTPKFVRVLQHQFLDNVLEWVRGAVIEGCFLADKDTMKSDKSPFGGIIFTSQRAVEAFSLAVSAIDRQLLETLLPKTLPLYVVGPATANAVRAIGLSCLVLGEHTGNGDVLADFILEDYSHFGKGGQRLPLLFLVGEQRRDIIPRKLQSEELSEKRRITVIEKTVYGTTEREDFAAEFAGILQDHLQKFDSTWIVVFSPTGCGAMLRVLGWLNEQHKYEATLQQSQGQRIYIATIGPTTRDFLARQFDYRPHVCAEKPSPEGVGQAIIDYKTVIRT
ncbi:tetrapyrrole biosynthesis, uroporphyrinogen III synthase [Myriangium duriaei CBS 260.36]|uniref:Tetrapyrrole biosynthesis, uroporphyrinogen III synthase n=1 Tax=Myriangium duriaei CBS 260.36 TaxID=1168546 RepID=A0A9P4IYZ6_9PEZI|nr:tetrapyrrole biosynthesis, uroporphyrinogen III synthase [Myriangium duriaei CBS 260.36]